MYTVQALPKKHYLCAADYNEPYFDFHCLSRGAPPDGSTVYKICGTPYPNWAEYVVIIIASSLFGLAVFHQVLTAGTRRKAKIS